MQENVNDQAGEWRAPRYLLAPLQQGLNILVASLSWILSLPFRLVFTSRLWKALLKRLRIEEKDTDPRKPDEVPKAPRAHSKNSKSFIEVLSDFPFYIVFSFLYSIYYPWKQLTIMFSTDNSSGSAPGLATPTFPANQNSPKPELAVNRSPVELSEDFTVRRRGKVIQQHKSNGDSSDEEETQNA